MSPLFRSNIDPVPDFDLSHIFNKVHFMIFESFESYVEKILKLTLVRLVT